MRSVIRNLRPKAWMSLAFAALVLAQSFIPASARFLPLVPREFEAAVQLGGVRHHVLVRGPADAPVLILVHGAPGVNENPLFRQYLPELERSFQVVYWEQRGPGKSLLRLVPAQDMSIAQSTRELSELVEFTSRKFKQDKVYLLAHAWGTVPAALYVQQHPDRVAAYVGISQLVDVPASEREGWEWALAQAKTTGDAKAIAALEAIGAPPYDGDAMLVSRKWIERFGGMFHQKMQTKNLLFTALKDNNTNIVDLVAFGGDNRQSLDRMWSDISAFRLPSPARWETPVVLISGSYDHVASPALAAKYYASIDALCKKWVTYEDSAHHPHFEEPKAFVKFLTVDLIPWVKSCPAGVRPVSAAG